MPTTDGTTQRVVRNVWGTPTEDVGEGYCPDCEREDSAWGWRQHYTNCPHYTREGGA